MTSECNDQHDKRTRMRGTERRELIMSRAKEVFAHYGYAEASTGELARASEVTEPMLYKHFGSKKGLFMEILRECGKQFLDLWSKKIQQRSENSIPDALAHIITDYCDVIKKDTAIHKVLYHAVTESHDSDIALCINRHNQKIYSMIYQLLESARSEGYIASNVDLNVATWGFVSIIHTLQYSLILNTENTLNSTVIADLSDMWLRSLRTSKR